MTHGAHIGELTIDDRTRKDGTFNLGCPDDAPAIERDAFNHAVRLLKIIVGIEDEKIMSALDIIEHANWMLTLQLEIDASCMIQYFAHDRYFVSLSINIYQHGIRFQRCQVPGFHRLAASVVLLKWDDACYFRFLLIGIVSTITTR